MASPVLNEAGRAGKSESPKCLGVAALCHRGARGAPAADTSGLLGRGLIRQAILTDLHFVAGTQLDGINALAVHVRSVERTRIANDVPALRGDELAVLTRHRHVIEEDISLRRATGVGHLGIQEETGSGVGAALNDQQGRASGQSLDSLTGASRQGNRSLLNVIRERRGAAGGDEAALFAGDLLTMYQKYAEAQGWRFEVMEASMNGVGGFKEVVAMVSGQSVYSKLKYESGAHRVQRVPVTESQGRVHTSTATVLVMPEVEEVEYDIDPKDLRVDIYHASGAGGQNVNKVATAVRIVHLPTNIKVEMQEERTQQKNREKAMKIIRARVADHFAQIAQDEQDAERKSTIGTGDRSERIRTYNFPQNRVTDHRIGLTLQKLDTILSGKLDEVVDALVLYDQTQKLEELNK